MSHGAPKGPTVIVDMELPGITFALPDGRIARDKVRDGLYLLQALHDGDVKRAAEYVAIGADLSVVEAVRQQLFETLSRPCDTDFRTQNEMRRSIPLVVLDSTKSGKMLSGDAAALLSSMFHCTQAFSCRDLAGRDPASVAAGVDPTLAEMISSRLPPASLPDPISPNIADMLPSHHDASSESPDSGSTAQDFSPIPFNLTPSQKPPPPPEFTDDSNPLIIHDDGQQSKHPYLAPSEAPLPLLVGVLLVLATACVIGDSFLTHRLRVGGTTNLNASLYTLDGLSSPIMMIDNVGSTNELWLVWGHGEPPAAADSTRFTLCDHWTPSSVREAHNSSDSPPQTPPNTPLDPLTHLDSWKQPEYQHHAILERLQVGAVVAFSHSAATFFPQCGLVNRQDTDIMITNETCEGIKNLKLEGSSVGVSVKKLAGTPHATDSLVPVVADFTRNLTVVSPRGRSVEIEGALGAPELGEQSGAKHELEHQLTSTGADLEVYLLPWLETVLLAGCSLYLSVFWIVNSVCTSAAAH